MPKECIVVRKHMSSKVWRTRASQSTPPAIWKSYPRFQSFLVYAVFVLFVPSGPDYITGKYKPRASIPFAVGWSDLVILAYGPIDGDCIFAGGVYFPVPRSYFPSPDGLEMEM
jgi:hypothetical protein